MGDYELGRNAGHAGMPGAYNSPEYWSGFHSTGAWNQPAQQFRPAEPVHTPAQAPRVEYSGPGFGWLGRLVIFLILLAIYSAIGLI